MKNYFTKGEILLWSISSLLIIVSYCYFKCNSPLMLSASLLGVTSLIFNAKGNPFGQLLMIIFSILYGIISYTNAYYGEMITYLGMTMPMAIFAFISWLKNPYKGNKSEVRVNRISKKECILMWTVTAMVTVGFFCVLKALNTARLVLSTISVTTSFAAVYLTARRSASYALGYAANDVVLIALWILASFEKREYISVVVCFAAFLINDIYGFINWRRIEKRQRSNM